MPHNTSSRTAPDFWLGTYTGDGDGTAHGIVSLTREDAGTLRPSSAHDAQSPSWLTVHPQHGTVYAAEEFTGRVRAFAPEGGRLQQTDALQLDAGACHLSLASDGWALVASCFGTGEVVWMPLTADGGFAGERVLAASPQDPYAVGITGEGARAPHAHQTRWLPNGFVVSTDLGFDLVRVWRPTASGLEPVQQLALPQGVGPRHTRWHESGHLHVVTEHSAEVFTLRFDDAGTLRIVSSVQATADSLEDGDTGAEISTGRSDRMYVTIRGSNRVSTLEVRGDGSQLRPIGDVGSGGNWPRHHHVDGPLLHVANQFSGSVATLRIDERSGIPTRLIGTVETGTPTCLAAV